MANDMQSYREVMPRRTRLLLLKYILV
jgi:hypothetical protein